MNCQEFWTQTPDRSGVPSPEWLAHSRECPACAPAWAHQQNLAAGLRLAAAEWAPMEAPVRIEKRLLNAFRAHSGLGMGTPRPVRPWMSALTWASAAAAVLILAISLVRIHEPPSVVAPKRIPTNAAILAAVQDSSDGAVASVDNAVLDGGFVPLPNVEQLAPNEQGDVVRLELPRSAMMALGFEVSPERAAEPVQAEVIYGPDGVARAVRFLDDTF